jgi:nucleotide-binding universal stress UspA family protein
MYKRIMIGYDGSDGANDALVLGRKMAEFEDAAIRVVYVYPYEPIGRAANGEYDRLVRFDADAEIAGARRELGDRPDTEFLLVPGLSPPRELHRIAEEWHADLIVVGSSERAGHGHIAIGRVGERTLQGSACPVLVAPWGYREVAARFRRIGVGFNGSGESHAALDEAAAIADAADAELLIVDVVDVGEGLVATNWWFYNFHDCRDDLRVIVEAAAAKAAEGLTRPAETVVPVGDAAAELIKWSHDLDLLVVGSRGYGPMRRLLLGSVSNRLVRSVACPILVLPRGVHGGTTAQEASTIADPVGDPR